MMLFWLFLGVVHAFATEPTQVRSAHAIQAEEDAAFFGPVQESGSLIFVTFYLGREVRFNHHADLLWERERERMGHAWCTLTLTSSGGSVRGPFMIPAGTYSISSSYRDVVWENSPSGEKLVSGFSFRPVNMRARSQDGEAVVERVSCRGKELQLSTLEKVTGTGLKLVAE